MKALLVVFFISINTILYSQPLVQCKATQRYISFNYGNSVDVHLLLIANKDAQYLTIDSITNDYNCYKKFKLSVIGKNNTDSTFTKGDTLLIQILMTNLKVKKLESLTVHYHTNKLAKRKKSLKIKELTELQAIFIDP